MTIFITGAATGIGAAIARQLASQTNHLVLIDIQADKLKQFAAELRDKCPAITEMAGDLTDPGFIASITDYAANNSIDILINNAAVAHPLNSFEKLTDDQLDLAYKLNIKAPFKLIQAVLPSMQQQGQILNFASRANIYGYANMAIYAATKAAISSLTGTVALENPQVKAVTIIPGRTNTQMQSSLRGVAEAQKSQSPEYVAKIVEQVIRGEVVTTSGDFVIIDQGEFKVESELDKADLHRNMH